MFGDSFEYLMTVVHFVTLVGELVITIARSAKHDKVCLNNFRTCSSFKGAGATEMGRCISYVHRRDYELGTLASR